MTTLVRLIPALSRNALLLLGLTITLLTCVIALYNLYIPLKTLPAEFRVTISALLFTFAFLTSSIHKPTGLKICVLLLPLLPNLTFQILTYTGYGRILNQGTSGLDLVAGFICGALVNTLLTNKKLNKFAYLPWPASLLVTSVTLSVVLAILRNLSQSEAPFSIEALVYTLSHIRSINWHDDYRPLFDWVIYGVGISFFAVMLPILKDANKRDNLIFKPLLIGILIAAVVGLIQNRSGMGLTASQMQFRSDKMSNGIDLFGFSAVGFQPDIHAYAGHLMLGAVGLLGYFFYSQEKLIRILIPVVVMPLAFIALVASKSKSSIVLTFLFLFVMLTVWIFRHSKYLQKLIYLSLIFIIALVLSFYFFQDHWQIALTHLAKKLGFPDLYAMNFSLAFRPEIFIAGLRMLSEFPLLGLGQGDFYRLSAIPAFSHSPFLSETLNGENAHNYFIQTLVENGVIGFCIFIIFLCHPVLSTRKKSVLVPALVGLGSIFLGNLYAHSLLVRENFFLCTAMFALLYAWTPSGGNKQNDTCTNNQSIWVTSSLTFLILLIFILSIREAYTSFKKFPFTYDYQCFKRNTLTQDGWTAGIYSELLPPGNTGVLLKIQSLPPGTTARPLKAKLAILNEKDIELISENYELTETELKELSLSLPPNIQSNSQQTKFMLKLDRCFVPKNFGMGADERRLGIRLHPVNYLQR